MMMVEALGHDRKKYRWLEQLLGTGHAAMRLNLLLKMMMAPHIRQAVDIMRPFEISLSFGLTCRARFKCLQLKSYSSRSSSKFCMG